MQADAQTGQAPRARDRVRRGCTADHQAGCGEDAQVVRGLDGRIDLRREPEIIGRDNQTLQSAISRSRRNLKNSSPSRSRRFIISGLRSISPTIDAIFGARK